ncbi:MAG TPA: dipeptidase [Planctomycetaceae bacterium]|nr:dipeptidase [Planctomycetaceae bacterium]
MSKRPLAGLMGMALFAMAAASAAAQDVTVSETTWDIIRSGLLFDGHNDLPWQMRELGGGSFDRLDIAVPQPKLHTDIPKLKQSSLKAQFWSVYVPAETDVTGDALVKTLEQIDIVHAMLKRYPETFELAKTADDVERIAKSGKIASMLGVEGGYSMQGSLPILKRFHDLGVRYMTLTHNKTIFWADAATDKPQHDGLTEFGEEVVREMNRLGLLVDLSHVSPDTMRDALRVTSAPVIFSHSSTRAICDHPRNVPDDILRELPKNGGVVMINFFSGFIVPTEELKRDKNARGTLAQVADHIDHAVKAAGIDHVGLGADFDGVTRLPVGLEDVSTYPALTQELVNRGYNRDQLHKILGGNILRALRRAEVVANAPQR